MKNLKGGIHFQGKLVILTGINIEYGNFFMDGFIIVIYLEDFPPLFHRSPGIG